MTLNKVRDSYPNRECPDCHADIPINVVEGQECDNCGHIFFIQDNSVKSVIADAIISFFPSLEGSGRLESNLKEVILDNSEEDSEVANMIDGVESLILALACEGVDIESEEFVRAINSVIETLSNI